MLQLGDPKGGIMTTSPSTTDSDFAFDPKWGIESPSTTMFDFNYTGGRDQLLRL